MADAAPDAQPLTRAERIFVRISILQTILAVAGVFTGAVALYAALSEADAVRKQQQAAVWPYVRMRDMNFGTPGEERIDIVVGNRGIGPARIKNVSMMIDGQPYFSWYDVLDPLAERANYSISNYPILGEVLSPDEDITIVSVDAKYASLDLVTSFRELIRSGRANMQICYCSVFEDCWELDALKNATEPIAECAAPDPQSGI